MPEQPTSGWLHKAPEAFHAAPPLPLLSYLLPCAEFTNNVFSTGAENQHPGGEAVAASNPWIACNAGGQCQADGGQLGCA